MFYFILPKFEYNLNEMFYILKATGKPTSFTKEEAVEIVGFDATSRFEFPDFT